jgi:RES domain-containing protein
MSVEVAFRISAWDTPLRVNPNRSGARFNEPGSPATQYLSLHPLGPWAQYIRFNELRDERRLAGCRLRLWAIRVDLSSALEITFSSAERHGLRPGDLVGESWGGCRRFAEALRGDAAAPKTIVVPSAALPGTREIVIFGERVAIPFDRQPLGHTDLPATIVAEGAAPPPGLTAYVCQRGEQHPGLAAWEEGRLYRPLDKPTFAGGAAG